MGSASAGSAAAVVETAPPLPIDASVTFSTVLRSDDLGPTITVLEKETVLHTSSLVLRVAGDEIVQDADDLRGVDLVLTRSAAAFTNLAGPTFREAFLEITPGARRFGSTLVYRPAAASGPFAGFRAVNYAHKNAEGYGFRRGPKGSIWGVSITPVEGEEFLTHLAGPEIWPAKPTPTPELGDPSWKRSVEADDGAVFTIGTSGGKDVVLLRKAGEANGTISPLPGLAETIKTIGFTFSPQRADLAFVHASVPDLGPGKPPVSYAAVWNGKSWDEEPSPRGQLLVSFCLRTDGTRWAVSRPAGAELAGASRLGEQQLLRRAPTGGWQRIGLPPRVFPANVTCDDPRDVWISAVDPADTERGGLVMRSRPLKNGSGPAAEVSIVDWPRDGDVRRDIEPAPIMVSASAPQPATSVCPKAQLWALLAQEGGRIPQNWDEEPARTAKDKAARAKALAEKKRAGADRLRPLLAGTTLPEGAKLELIGKAPNRWIATLVPDYAAGRKLVDASIIRFPEERPKLLCVNPDKRAPYVAGVSKP